MRIAALTAAAVAAVLAIAGAGATSQERHANVDVTELVVDLGATRQVIQGFGSSNRVWSDPHVGNSSNTSVPIAAQAQILTALYNRLGLTRVRNLLDNGLQQSPGGPMSFEGKRADDHIAFVKQARRFGLRTFFPAPVYLEDWMKADDPGAYVNWAMTMLRRWRARGLAPAFYAPLNEPEIGRDFPPEWLHDVVVQLGERMRAAGFKTKLVIPDDENPSDAYLRAVAVLADPKARKHVGAIAFHTYGKNSPERWQALRRLATQYRLPLWMTEYNSKSFQDWDSSIDWAVQMHELLTVGDVNAVDYLFAFFGNWIGNNTLIRIDFDNGEYRSFTPTALYYMTGQYSRYVRPGYVRVHTAGSDAPSLVSAFTGQGRLVVVALNPGNRTESVRVRVRRGLLASEAMAVRSSSTERWKQLDRVPVRNQGMNVTLPPRSITTLIVRRVGRNT